MFDLIQNEYSSSLIGTSIAGAEAVHTITFGMAAKKALDLKRALTSEEVASYFLKTRVLGFLGLGSRLWQGFNDYQNWKESPADKQDQQAWEMASSFLTAASIGLTLLQPELSILKGATALLNILSLGTSGISLYKNTDDLFQIGTNFLLTGVFMASGLYYSKYTSQAFKQIPCFRTLDDKSSLPFLGKSRGAVKLTVTSQPDGSFNGVHFSEDPAHGITSPHVRYTHVESAFHIRGEGEDTLALVLNRNPEYQKPLPALHLKVKPTKLKPTFLEQGSVIRFSLGPESYSVKDTVMTRGAFENVITRESLRESDHLLNRVKLFKGQKKAILLNIEGGEKNIEDWPYLTHEAITYLTDEKGFDVIVLNTPSMDRKVDGGLTPNHEVVFGKNPNRLIIELANLQHIPANGWYSTKLNLLSHTSFEDCGQARPTILSPLRSFFDLFLGQG